MSGSSQEKVRESQTQKLVEICGRSLVQIPLRGTEIYCIVSCPNNSFQDCVIMVFITLPPPTESTIM